MFKKIKSLGGMFKKSLKGMVQKDVENLESDALIRMYNRVKFIFGSMWNSILDKVIYAFLKSAMVDAEEIIVKCKRAGENIYDFLPVNLTRRLSKNYF